MDAIKSYLEAMFANMPNTEAVKRAKRELAQMMEDKYNELIANGSTENEAVGAVISGFGNLEDLAEELGVTEEVKEEKINTAGKRHVTFDEASSFVAAKHRQALMMSAGIAFCILSLSAIMIAETFGVSDGLQVLFFFGSIAVGVVLIVFANAGLDAWKYLKKKSCYIDMETVNVIAESRANFKPTKTVLLTVGILLCSLCWMFPAVMDSATLFGKSLDDTSAALMFSSVAVGVFLIVYSSTIDGAYEKLLKLNDAKTIAGEYVETVKKKKSAYASPKARMIMDLFWPVVTCLYFIYSFQSGEWGLTWLIWVIGGGAYKALDRYFKSQEEDENGEK